MNLKAFFLSRRTVITLILILFAGVVIGTFLPQQFITPERQLAQWRDANQWAVPLVRGLGLDHVYSTPWFTAALLLAIVALGCSTFEQFRSAWRRSFGPPPASTGTAGVWIRGTRAEFARVARRKGYFQVGNGTPRFIRNIWGHWGNGLLHLGILTVMVSALIIALSYKRCEALFFKGRVYDTAVPWANEEHGLLAGRLKLPEPFVLNEVDADFWPNGKTRQITSTVSFSPLGRAPRTLRVAVSSMQNYGGCEIYQTLDFGHAFHLRFIGPSGETRETILPIVHPESLEKPEYEEFTKEWLPYELQAKYFADVEKRSLLHGTPQLGLRLAQGQREIGRVSLKQGEEGQLGEYRVALIGVSFWSRLVFVSMTGMPGIFFGFFIIILGAGLYYLFPPREIVANPDGEGLVLCFQSSRFRELFTVEFAEICSEFSEDKR